MRCLLVGNYGVGNLGDEALREFFVDTFPAIEWRVLSAHPQMGEFHRLPGGFVSFLSFRWIRTLKELRSCDAVVFGGGSLFTDTESVYACVLWWWHAFICAVLFRKPVHFAFQGIGPFRTKAGEWFARCACRLARSLSVRDVASLARVESWCLNKKIVQSFDPVFCLLQEEKTTKSTNKVFIIVPRKNSSEVFQARALQLLRTEQWNEVRILSLQPEDSEEQEVCEHLRNALGKSVRILPIETLEELISQISEASLVLSQRYHAALAALALGVPFTVLPQEKDDKLAALQAGADTVSVDQQKALVDRGIDHLRKNLGV